MSDKCRCRDLQQIVVGRFVYVGLRCPHCIDLIIESKNELVRENNVLRERLSKENKVET